MILQLCHPDPKITYIKYHANCENVCRKIRSFKLGMRRMFLKWLADILSHWSLIFSVLNFSKRIISSWQGYDAKIIFKKDFEELVPQSDDVICAKYKRVRTIVTLFITFSHVNTVKSKPSYSTWKLFCFCLRTSSITLHSGDAHFKKKQNWKSFTPFHPKIIIHFQLFMVSFQINSDDLKWALLLLLALIVTDLYFQ